MSKVLFAAAKVLLALALVGGGATVARLWPVPVEGRAVSAGPIVAEVLGIGSLESTREVRVAFEASGRVTALEFDEGDVVAEGDVLGVLDVDDATRELDVSAASARGAWDDIDRAQADLDRGQAAADLAARDRIRTEALFKGGDVATVVVEAAVERDESAKATVRGLEAALRRARSNQVAASGSQRIREARVSDGQLPSPLSGLVVARSVEVGQWVAAGSPAFTIVDAAAFEVKAWVDETALARLDVGQPARLVFRSEPDRSYPGRVTSIGREVDRNTHELLVDVAVLELPKNFAVGQRADAWIEVGRSAATARVPRGWCDATCLVDDGGRVASRPVTLGLVGRDDVQVLAGLVPGDVVLAPDAPLGRRVRVEAQ